jgi:hypothetical protein
MTTQKTSTGKFAGIKEDILGAGMHLLSGAGGDIKQLIQQAVKSVIGEAYVSRQEYESLARRVAALEGKTGKKPAKTAAKKPASKAKPARK